MQESTAFKPKYKDSHWLQFFALFIVYTIIASTYLSDQVGINNKLNIPFSIDNNLLVLGGLFSIAAIFRLMSFLANENIRIIELNNDGIVFHRLLGRRLTAKYKSVKWNDNVLTLSKRHSFTIVSISNSKAMKEYLEEYLDGTPDEPVENESKKVKTDWDKQKVLSVMVAIIAIVVLFGSVASLIDSWGFHASDALLWAIDGVLAVILCQQAFFIGRNLFSESTI